MLTNRKCLIIILRDSDEPRHSESYAQKWCEAASIFKAAGFRYHECMIKSTDDHVAFDMSRASENTIKRAIELLESDRGNPKVPFRVVHTITRESVHNFVARSKGRAA